jgi:dTDP-4-amino-4,6-dideoxygalactose transaminase
MITDDLTPGVYEKEFRTLLSRTLGLTHTIVFNNYIQPFETIFAMIEALPDDEVVLPSFARYRIYNAVASCGLKPVLVDIEEDSLLPLYDRISEQITDHTRCLIIPQMFGIPNDLSKFVDFGLPIIEDLDGALCSTINGTAIGSFGTFVTMNLNDDSLITTGSGGLLASNQKKLKEVIEGLKSDESSYDYVMSDFNASLGISQLKKLEKNWERRRRIGEYYDNAVMASNCSLIGRKEGQDLCFSSYVVKTETPIEDVIRFFKRSEIPVRRGIEIPLHHHMNLKVDQFRRTEELYNKIIILPIYPTLDKATVENVAKGIRAIL